MKPRFHTVVSAQAERDQGAQRRSPLQGFAVLSSPFQAHLCNAALPEARQTESDSELTRYADLETLRKRYGNDREAAAPISPLRLHERPFRRGSIGKHLPDVEARAGFRQRLQN